MILPPGSTSISIQVQIVDDTGLPVTGLVAATFPATYYIKAQQAPVAINLTDLAQLTSAYSSGGIKEIAGGYYRLDVPDAAFTVASRVRVYAEQTNKRLIYPPITVGYADNENLLLDIQTTANNIDTTLATVKTDAATAALDSAAAKTAAESADSKLTTVLTNQTEIQDSLDSIILTISGSGFTVTLVSPLSEDGTLTIVQGDDYFAADNRAIDFIIAGGPDLTDAECRLQAQKGSLRLDWDKTDILTPAATSKTIRFEPSQAETAAIPATGNWQFQLFITLANGHELTPKTGDLTVKKRPYTPPVP